MAILKIARMGHPVLRGRAQPVEDPTAPEIRRLIEDMLETMDDADGVGLAAPQVHVPLRLVVFRLPPERLTPGQHGEAVPDAAAQTAGQDVPMALINPVLEPLGPEQELGWEGCLSGGRAAFQCPGCVASCRGSPACAIGRSTSTAAHSSVSPKASMPGWCSMNVIILMVFSIPCG
jgi:peptide deformylase